ncbi:hypothetical protein [Anatilimnocola floriformis]|uniref:hypothetical protein n=1 Tax=Anatilimnocola floriformis TaxID=2948575 RepID=UPI0020C24AD7|nr:hypothetical protein [Anatilimnocola floriformis]
MTVLNDLYDTSLAAIDSADTLCDLARPFIQMKARRLVGTAGFKCSDQPDIEQEAYIRLIERFEKARDVGELPVLFFIKQIVDQSIANQVRARKSQCRNRRTLSIHSPSSELDGAELSHSLRDDTVHGQSQNWWHWQKTIDIKDTIANLRPEEQELCVQLGIISIAEIVRNAKLPRSTLQDRVSRLRSKMREHQLNTGA